MVLHQLCLFCVEHEYANEDCDIDFSIDSEDVLEHIEE